MEQVWSRYGAGMEQTLKHFLEERVFLPKNFYLGKVAFVQIPFPSFGKRLLSKCNPSLQIKEHQPLPKANNKDKQLDPSIPKLKQAFKGINIPMPSNSSPIPSSTKKESRFERASTPSHGSWPKLEQHSPITPKGGQATNSSNSGIIFAP
jgi:hypothetical protein